ncbi:MAG TPA: AmmeMemoRadiSam system protein A [Candidatus Dormibacteraeota bacterium]|nr:AmmeMemoRadiSam system protein A [Candidatus Dormibacteraeota bacterium]
MSPLAHETRAVLLRLARQAIESAVVSRPLEDLPALPDFTEPRGAFVTLTRHGHLRGCIGQVAPVDPLVRVVVQCAVAAATDDPRFAPVAADEVPHLEIELSLLSRPKVVRFDEIEVGQHGLIATCSGKTGLLLPQVADEKNWPVERFLEETCLKAGLDAYAWKKPETRIEAFTAEVFSERDFERMPPQGLARA